MNKAEELKGTKYGKCSKCGAIIKTEDEFSMCMGAFPGRISNICGGYFVEISEREFREHLGIKFIKRK